MEATLKDAKCDIVLSGYGVYPTIWKDLRGNPHEEAMLCYPRRHYNPPDTRRCFSKIGSRSSQPPPFFTPLPISVLVTERFNVSPYVFKWSLE